jgi:hypothetical protein
METALLGAPLGRIGGLELVARGKAATAARTAMQLVGGDATHLYMVRVR